MTKVSFLRKEFRLKFTFPVTSDIARDALDEVVRVLASPCCAWTSRNIFEFDLDVENYNFGGKKFATSASYFFTLVSFLVNIYAYFMFL